jgi:hypothetical protein
LHKRHSRLFDVKPPLSFLQAAFSELLRTKPDSRTPA